MKNIKTISMLMSLSVCLTICTVSQGQEINLKGHSLNGKGDSLRQDPIHGASKISDVVFILRDSASGEILRIRRDPGISYEQKNIMIQAIRTATATAIQQAIKQAGYQSSQSDGRIRKQR